MKAMQNIALKGQQGLQLCPEKKNIGYPLKQHNCTHNK